jgi:hypothetical protein
MGLLLLLSIGSSLWFVSGSYLFYIPLLTMAVSAFLRKWSLSAEVHAFEKEQRINVLGGIHYSTEKFACQKMCGF